MISPTTTKLFALLLQSSQRERTIHVGCGKKDGNELLAYNQCNLYDPNLLCCPQAFDTKVIGYTELNTLHCT